MAVVIRGLDETVRAFNRLDKRLAKETRDELKKVAEPVMSAARGKVAAYRGSRPGSIRPRARGASVYVTQGAKKVTGKRGDFGLLQQRKLEEALEENEAEVYRGVEGFLDRFSSSEGF